MKLKNDIEKKGIIHFIGIGGIGMSGIAELMFNQGYQVQGSDTSFNANINRLKKKKIKIFSKHSKSNLKNISAVVYSSAIKKNNPEIIASKKLSIPLVSRAEMLAELMKLKKSIAIAGSHGKTTTTSLIGSILEKANIDPTIVNGGIINSLSNNHRLGLGEWMLVEADESDGSFLKLPNQINVITNIDYEHMDYYRNNNNLFSAFKTFATKIPFYGRSIICINDKNSKKISESINTRKIITYDYQNNLADVNIKKIQTNKKNTVFWINVKKNVIKKYEGLYRFNINLLGKHNVLNSTASIIVAFLLGIKVQKIQNALKGFQGVKRRFNFLGKINKCSIYDDYAHHPTEIQASYEIAKILKKNKIIVIFQPHRFTRTKALYLNFIKELKKINILYIAEIFSAGEKNIKNINSFKLVKDLKKNNLNEVYFLKNQMALDKTLSKYYNEDNIIVFMGAGSISSWAQKLMEINESVRN